MKKQGTGRKKRNRRRVSPVYVIAVMILSLLLFSIAIYLLHDAFKEENGAPASNEGYADTGFIPAVAGNYDSVDTAAVVGRDTENQTITFLNPELGKRYTLNYDGATVFTNKYGQGIALSQLENGTMVDVTFMHMRKRLNTLQVSTAGFSIKDIENFKPENGGRSVVINGERYSIAESAAVILPSGTGEMMDISIADNIRVCGLEHTIYSINVDRGHGYLRLENTAAFEGGWIQLGDALVYQITKDMFIPVPTGNYTAYISKDGVSGEEALKVSDGAEISMDLSKYQTEPLYGGIIFTVTPQNANVYLDGEKADITDEVELSYGLHQMVVTAQGYETVSRYIRVAEPHATLGVTLVSDGSPTASPDSPAPTPALGTASENSASDNSASENSASQNSVSVDTAVSANTVPTATPTSTPDVNVTPTPTSASNVVTPGVYYVTIESPEGVEVYLDGTYLGISPVKFEKKAGTYVITLRKNGCQTRSYTISVDAEKENVSYSFSELLKIDN
ncbi:MAG: PEGA domain-containing protein [Lachnospiraceae bacterium]|nr:PEGA domain-containing protein [Lachnospiraceae bacterium]